ncbi:MAG: hypothetical protein MZV70_43305 [Desulfobacterales bacterium]|nr:hypothetical protein [Desulfobacterales bacterium]
MGLSGPVIEKSADHAVDLFLPGPSPACNGLLYMGGGDGLDRNVALGGGKAHGTPRAWAMIIAVRGCL